MSCPGPSGARRWSGGAPGRGGAGARGRLGEGDVLPWAFGVEEVERALAELADQGLAVEAEGRWRALAATSWVAGTVELLDEGDALVRAFDESKPESRREP